MNGASIRIAGLYRYPLKSGRGEALERAQLGPRGLAGDREWMLVRPDGRFLTQREHPRLALLGACAIDDGLQLAAPGLAPLLARPGASCEVQVWRDRVLAHDAGEAAAAALSGWLGTPCRLVRFDPARVRLSEPGWTGDIEASNAFSDGYPLLVVNRASLEDLARRVGRELPVERFRPNLLVDGLEPWAEDRLATLRLGAIELRLVKACTRCRITTVDPASGAFDGEEPLRTLMGFRHDRLLRGATFGHNMVIAAGVGATLAVGATLLAHWRPAADDAGQ